MLQRDWYPQKYQMPQAYPFNSYFSVMDIDIQQLVVEMVQWHQQFLQRNRYEPSSVDLDQEKELQERWRVMTEYIPQDTFILGVPFYDLSQPMWKAGTEKFFGNRELSVMNFLEYIHPSHLGCYFLMGQASYEMAAKPEYRAHAAKGNFSSKLEFALRHYINNRYYSITQVSEPALFDKKENLLFHINSYRIGNELSPKELKRYLAQITYGPVEKHVEYSNILVREAGKIIFNKLEPKERLVLLEYLRGIEENSRLRIADIAEATGLTTRAITSANEKLIRMGNTYLPFQQFATAQKFLQFAHEQGFFFSELKQLV